MAVFCSFGKRKRIEEVFHRILDAFKSDIDYSRGIFLKPNIVFPVKDKTGKITRLSFTRSLIEVMREREPGVDIVIGEGVAAGCDPMENFRVSGYLRLADELNVALIDLHKAERTDIDWKFGTLSIPRIAFDRVYINLPILKPSSACLISGAMKNQKGLADPHMKKQFHRQGLHEQITMLNAAIRPSLSIVDCSNYFGKQFILAGNQCVEIDEMICRWLEIKAPEYIKLSRKNGLCSERIVLSGNTPRFRKISNRPVQKRAKHMGKMRLWANPRACSMCRYFFQDLKRFPSSMPGLMTSIKFVQHAILGAEIVMGLEPKFEKKRRRVICVGDCTRTLAKANKYNFIPGCPPKTKKVYKYL